MILKLGDSGPDVGRLQRALGIDDDEIFGQETLAAVQAFQKAHGLVPDGYVGPLTIAALESDHGTPSTPVTPIVVPSTGGPIKGIDIYSGDVVTNWAQIAQGNAFVISKSSENGWEDKLYRSHIENTKKAGMIAGGYHFFHYNSDPIAQAKFVAGVVSNLDKTDFPPIVDWEYSNGNPGHGDDVKVKAYIDEIQALTGRIPMIYSNKYIFDFFNNPSWVASHGLWLAAYGVSAPKIPAPYKNYTLWQFTESAHIPGLGNPGDQNIFQGSLDDLKAFIKTT